MKTVYIFRGICGAGKTTYCLERFPDALVCSADHFWGKDYNFIPSQAFIAHKVCFEKFTQAIENNVEEIVVDNTNVLLSYFKEYIKLAEENDYNIIVLRFAVDIEKAIARNVHGVNRETVENMVKKFQDYPGEMLIDVDR